ncbi:MAG: hypothetical protein AABY15_09165 [Nanoarchaeota archaeon]
MVREDIIGILRTALQRGKNLQQTIQSLYNSGYAKNEVDEAVQAINMYGLQQPVQQPSPIQKQPVQQPKQPATQGQTPQIASYYPASQTQQPLKFAPQQPQFYQPQQFPQPQFTQYPQIVSNYGQNPRPKTGTLIIIIMAAMLLVLIGILVVVFMFKPEITNFINNL